MPPAGGPPEIENNHAFIGGTAQPAGVGIPFSAGNSGQPDWAGPYDLVPMDPLNNSSSSTASEFGSTPVAKPPEATATNFGQGHQVAPPHQMTQGEKMMADTARQAVEQAITGASYNNEFPQPIQALNAQPLEPAPAPQAVQPPMPQSPPVMPPMEHSDTPMLVLPTDNANSMNATQPIATQNGFVSGVAPPPVPPPLV
jgi:hypothetical protein